MAVLPRTLVGSSEARAPKITLSGRRALAGCVYFLFWALTGTGGVAPASEAQETVLAEFDMPFHGERVPALVVRVNFASGEYRFEIDTGSSATTFDVRLAALLGQQVADQLVSYPGGGELQNAYRAPEGRIGAMRLPPLEVVCRSVSRTSFSRAPKVDGILGADALRTCILMLDFDRGKISILRALPRDPGVRIDLVPGAALPTVNGVLAGCGSRNFVIDTGYNGEVGLCREDFASLTATGQILPTGTRRGGTLGGLFRMRVGVLRAVLSVGGHGNAAVNVTELPDIDNPLGTAVPGSDRPFNILGLDYLSRYVVTFDFPHRALYLRPGASFRALRLSEELGGIRLARNGDQVVVLSVRDRSEAGAYARPGDVLDSINGAATAEMTDAEVVRFAADGSIERNLEFRSPRRSGFRTVARLAFVTGLLIAPGGLAFVVFRRLRQKSFFVAYGAAAVIGALTLTSLRADNRWSLRLDAAPPMELVTAPPAGPDVPDAPTTAAAGPEGVTRDLLSHESFVNSIGMKLMLIPAGEFLMGSDESAHSIEEAFGNQQPVKPQWIAAEHPRHHVRITKPFFLGAYEVTKRQFAVFVETDHYRTDAEKDGKGGFGNSPNSPGQLSFRQSPEHTWQSWGVREGDSSPVVNISYTDAVAFCGWLSRNEGKHYRLPTEAEWEYACRAGSNTRFYNGDEPADLLRIGNVGDSAPTGSDARWRNALRAKGGAIFTCRVGRFAPNLFGLYDMIGNVAEWCSDWYGKEYYAHSPLDDPHGPAAGSSRVIRGGSWYKPPVCCRSAYRNFDIPTFRNCCIGFRVACER